MKDKPKKTSQSRITQSTEKSYPVYPIGSITGDIDRYHNRFIQSLSKTESTAFSKSSNVDQANSKYKVSINTSEIKSEGKFSPSKTSGQTRSEN